MPAQIATNSERDKWILDLRGPRNEVSSQRPYAFLVEQERFSSGETGPVATIFLTNRECPWRCTMCDLWRNTLPYSVASGDIPRQIEYALQRMPPARQIKLYNSGSFFDPRAIPPEDYPAIVALVRGFERVIVECHPALVSERCGHFQKQLSTQLEIAMGLETVHPEALEKLNKRMTPEQFGAAAERLHAQQIALRTFLLVHPPFIPLGETQWWINRSIDFALRCGSTVISLIPTRSGNGAMEQLEQDGTFIAPSLTSLECVVREGLMQSTSKGGRARIFADLWDAGQFASCKACAAARIDRLWRINTTQMIEAAVPCSFCGGSA